MRARKRNPFLGHGLDKRQARRARRRSDRRVALIEEFIGRHTDVQLEPWQRAMLERLYGSPPRPPVMMARAITRPRDWAPSARAHLFGLHTLNVDELQSEIDRHAAYGRVAAIEAVHRELRSRSAHG